MLAKCVSMAPPWGKFWFILFMSSVKQLKARASRERAQEKPSAPPRPKEQEVPKRWSRALSWVTGPRDSEKLVIPFQGMLSNLFLEESQLTPLLLRVEVLLRHSG